MESIDKLISLTIELEGLLRVAKEREEQRIDDEMAVNTLIRKFNELYEAFAEKYSDDEEEAATAQADSWHQNDDDESCTIIEEEVTAPEDYIDKKEEEQAPAEQTQTVINPTMMSAEAPTGAYTRTVQMFDTTQPTTGVPEENGYGYGNAGKDNMEQPPVFNPQTIAHDPIAPPAYQDMMPQQPMEAKDLSKCFTINDKYRFVRDLFNGERTKFDVALDRISQMNLVEAQMYMVDELGWDMDNPIAAEFMGIVNNFFNK